MDNGTCSLLHVEYYRGHRIVGDAKGVRAYECEKGEQYARFMYPQFEDAVEKSVYASVLRVRKAIREYGKLYEPKG